jgi:hypothetical protein
MSASESRQCISPGDWVQVRPEHDIPAMFRPDGPTRGRVASVEGGFAEVWVGGADVDEHSQAVPYAVEALERVDA